MKANGWKGAVIAVLICLIMMGVTAVATWGVAYYYFTRGLDGYVDEFCGPVVIERVCIEMSNPITGDKIEQCTIEQKGKAPNIAGSI